MQTISWGIIGCGNVTEIKSGPALNKVRDSQLIAVMRRDAAKAEDYARRHHVNKWYSESEHLINDPEVNAIYIATPPSSHFSTSINVRERASLLSRPAPAASVGADSPPKIIGAT